MTLWRASRPGPSAGIALLTLLAGVVATPPAAPAVAPSPRPRPAPAVHAAVSSTPRPASAPRLTDSIVSVFISTMLSNGRGSGFCVGDGSWVVTCYHVITQHMGDDQDLAVEQALVLSPWSGEALKARVVATDPKADLALLKLERGRLPALPVAAAAAFDPAKLADDKARFTIAGFGQTSAQLDANPEVHPGTAPVELLAAAEKLDRQVLLFVPSEGAGPGWSGGPVMNDNGWVVGVFRALVAQPQARDVWYPLATGAEPLRALLKANGVSLAPGGEPLPNRPTDAAALFQREFRSLAWSSARKWERAETERRAELLLRPNNSIAHLGLGLALMGQNRLDEALKEVETAVTLEPTRAGAFFQKGLTLQRMNRMAEAEECMRRSIEMEPGAVERRITLGALLAAEGKAAEATAVLRRAAELAPNHPLAHWRLGLCLQADGKADEAIAALRRAARLAQPLPPLRLLRVDLAEALQKAGKADEAEQEFRDLAREGDDPSTQYQLAAFLASRQKSPEALAALQKCLYLLEQHADPDLLKRATDLKTQLEGKAS